MSWVLPVLWVAVGVVIFVAMREMMNVQSRYRTIASLAAGVLWPALAVLLAAFLLSDLIEWLVRRAIGGDVA